MDTPPQWPQGIGGPKQQPVLDDTSSKKPRPQKEQALNCPRCSSTNTKFCYYNNYSLSQPRYFCKTCRRYWTEGGSLRNVPVGGGSRKNKRPSSSSSSKKVVLPNATFSPQNPKIHQAHDLNLAYNPSHFNGMSEFVALPFGARGLSASLMSMSIPPFSDHVTTSNSFTFPLHEYKPSLGFSLDGLDQNGFGSNIHQTGVVEDHHANPSRIDLFPFEELKQQTVSSSGFEQDRGHQGDSSTNGYWSGMLAGGSW